VSIVIIAGYFVLPFTSPLSTSTALLLILGLVAVAALLTWQIRAITRSPYPRARTVTALATTLPVFLVVFATVGFGDIVPVTAGARGVTTVQMLGDVVIVGLVAHVIVGAMRMGLRRRGLDDDLDEHMDDGAG
jgi:hypothetical protein